MSHYVIYLYCCQAQFLYQIIFMSFNSNTMGATSEAGIAYHGTVHEFTPILKWDSCCLNLSFLCSILPLFFWSLSCLSFKLPRLIIPLVSLTVLVKKKTLIKQIAHVQLF
jgi:hypothetical protein